jgi:hypothetical protein
MRSPQQIVDSIDETKPPRAALTEINQDKKSKRSQTFGLSITLRAYGHESKGRRNQIGLSHKQLKLATLFEKTAKPATNRTKNDSRAGEEKSIFIL